MVIIRNHTFTAKTPLQTIGRTREGKRVLKFEDVDSALQ